MAMMNHHLKLLHAPISLAHHKIVKLFYV